MSCVANSRNALIEMNTFIGWYGWRNVYCDGSYSRRIIPPMPRMCIGKKTRL